ncbi:MAG: hypothetical protein JWM11_369, partial [Planctomycetaceae bacterium]|nr:hypothetical protein [Planctomycetaceae bacterium]
MPLTLRCVPVVFIMLFASPNCQAIADDVATPPPNTWRRLDGAALIGQRTDIPIDYSPALKQFLILGGRTHSNEYRQPRSYDTLALNRQSNTWENQFPVGKTWGPLVGACQAPTWKDEQFRFQDTEGNVRPNWTIYGTFSLGRKYDYDPVNERFVFYAGGHTFAYHPVKREWSDLAPETHPESQLGGILLWSSMCYDDHNQRFILFGGGNLTSPRGGPGTWAYLPATNKWQQLNVAEQPRNRANSQLVYDPIHRMILLFGGDTLSSLVNDTWTFDVVKNRWELQLPKSAPAPRAGHALHWLPGVKKLLLLGGYTYTSTTEYVASLYRPLPLEAWTYDIETSQWNLIEQFTGQSVPVPLSNRCLVSAVDADDTAVLLDQRNVAWICRFDASASDPKKTNQLSFPPDSVIRREFSHDPNWYTRDVPPADPQRVARELRELPTNTWVLRETPKRPEMNMDWGSAVLAPELDRIVRFSGGHSAYSGTAPQVYDLGTDRYSIPFAPEYPIEFVYSNDQVHGESSFNGNPWMTGHTYKSTGYDSRLKQMVYVPHEYTYFFDPFWGRWSRGSVKNPFRPDFYTNTVCSTPQGAIVWASKRGGGDGLWRLDAESRNWVELALSEKLPEKSADEIGLAYDSKRDRLLFFSNVGKKRGNVLAYDLQTVQTTWLDPKAMEHGAVPSRETIYLPDWDMVLLGARTNVDGQPYWLAYDCAANAWLGIELPGA